MTRSRVCNPDFHQAGDESLEAGRANTQIMWYEFASRFCADHDVLDVGCGLGAGLDALDETARTVRGIDVGAGTENERVRCGSLADEPSKSVDTIVNIDVIEHVLEDHRFIDELARVARRQILLSTPNFAASRCQWPYHVREYMPQELWALFRDKGRVHIYKGSQLGDARWEISHPRAFVALNKLWVHPLTRQPTRVFHKLLPERARIQSHLFIRVVLS